MTFLQYLEKYFGHIYCGGFVSITQFEQTVSTIKEIIFPNSEISFIDWRKKNYPDFKNYQGGQEFYELGQKFVDYVESEKNNFEKKETESKRKN